MPSKRKYPKRKCANLNCTHEKEFEPHDKRQLYCTLQCRTDASNDRRSLTNSTTYFQEKILRQYDKLLEKIHNRFLKDKSCIVNKAYLNYEGVDVSLLVEESINKKTGNKVKWFYRYGTELHPTDPDFFIIHKKPIL
jgi:hypothetical protein